MQKARIATTLCRCADNKGSLLESFTFEPKRVSTSVFLTDKAVKNICSESKFIINYMISYILNCQSFSPVYVVNQLLVCYRTSI